MKDYKMAEALANLPDDLLLEAADVQKKPYIFRRLLSIAASFVIVLGLALGSAVYFRQGILIQQDTSAPTQKPQYYSMVGIQVQTSKGLVQLSANMDGPVYASDRMDNPGRVPDPPDDWRWYTYNTILGEWELVVKDRGERPPCLTLDIMVLEYMQQYSPVLTVFRNGEEVDFSDENGINCGLLFQQNEWSGWTVWCYCVEQTSWVFRVTDKNDGTVLLEQSILMTPALYTEEQKEGTTEVVLNEGYMLETLQKYVLTTNEGG